MNTDIILRVCYTEQDGCKSPTKTSVATVHTFPVTSVWLLLYVFNTQRSPSSVTLLNHYRFLVLSFLNCGRAPEIHLPVSGARFSVLCGEDIFNFC
jgi:hypothetical protein